jgi:hypothetical protein
MAVALLLVRPAHTHSAYVNQIPYFTVDKARKELGLDFLPVEVCIVVMGKP